MTETSSGRASQERIGHLRAICFSFLLFQVLAAAAGVLHPPAVGAVHAVRQLHHPETPQEASQEKNGRLGTHLGQQKKNPKAAAGTLGQLPVGRMVLGGFPDELWQPLLLSQGSALPQAIGKSSSHLWMRYPCCSLCCSLLHQRREKWKIKRGGTARFCSRLQIWENPALLVSLFCSLPQPITSLEGYSRS